MRLSSFVISVRGGLSLVEVMIAAAVTGVVVASVCGIYLAVSGEWQRQQGRAEALVAVSQACSRVSDYASQSVGAQTLDRFTAGDALALQLPADTAYSGVYVPVWSGGKLRYQGGGWIIFYLSDSTGSYYRSGNILWAATMSWVGFPSSVVPDKSWSLYYDTSAGKIAPLTSITFWVVNGGRRPIVTMDAVSLYRIGRTMAQVKQSRATCLRNAN